MNKNIEIMVGLIVATIAILIVLWVLRKFSEKIRIFIQDTLKEKQMDGTWKWSKTALTMATAWYSVLYAFFFDLVKTGFRMDSFVVMALVGTGIPIASAYAKKVNPLIQPPKDEPKD